MAHTARKVYEKVCNGDNITNAELQFGMTFYKELADKLVKCGPVFKLAHGEAVRTYLTLEGFYLARKRKV